MNLDMDDALALFVVESRELLEDMESSLLALRQAVLPEEIINRVFRGAHTIKGSAGMFGLDFLSDFTHDVETLLDRVRAGEQDVDGGLIDLLLSCCDHIGRLVDVVEAGKAAPDTATLSQGERLTARLQLILNEGPTGAAAAGESTRTSTSTRVGTAMVEQPGPQAERIGRENADGDAWHISLRFGPDVLRNGMDPLSFLRYLGRMGSITGILTLPDAMPDADEMDPESCYLGFEIALRSDADKAALEDVFEFVRDDCSVAILPPKSRVSEYVRLIEHMPSEPTRLGDLLVRCGTLTEHELEAALEQQKRDGQSRLGEILVDLGAVQPDVVRAALMKQEQVKQVKVQENRSIRVDADKLDHLINLVGELTIAAASTNLVARRAGNALLQESSSVLSGLVEDVRESALKLRMVKIGPTFNRFQRVVHDVARELGKDIGLVVKGEDTELDKTVVEKIADPLLHLVRNAIDHGIEAAPLRAARGKPARGRLSLNAFHDSGSIVIEVGDDGGGLDRERILAKGIERGLVEPGRQLSDSEVFQLIFEPGFSTAEQITSLSGRGVGMDVVKKNITALRGSVDIASQPGVGTTVTVRLPLTLAIINGFLVEVGDSIFVVPLEMVEECIAFAAEPDHHYIDLRGRILPFVRLREQFGVSGEAARRPSIVVVRYGNVRAGLVVDKLLGEFQTVVKPLARLFNRVRCISGSTILGSGEVALILDVPALVGKVAQDAVADSPQEESLRLT